jgi:hypothetical protein
MRRVAVGPVATPVRNDNGGEALFVLPVLFDVLFENSVDFIEEVAAFRGSQMLYKVGAMNLHHAVGLPGPRIAEVEYILYLSIEGVLIDPRKSGLAVRTASQIQTDDFGSVEMDAVDAASFHFSF